MSRPTKPPTLTDVARLAGVSVPTASRVLNGGVRGGQSGSTELRRRVKDAARALGYSVSPAAQAIKDGRARTVALVVSDISDFGSSAVIAGVMQAAEKRNVSVAVRTTRDDALREVELLTQLQGERHRAIIMATSRTTDLSRESLIDQHLTRLQDHGARIVIVGDSALPFPSVTVDNARVAAEFAQALVDTGLRRFAILSGPRDEVTAQDRLQGFLDGLHARGVEVPPERIVHRDFSRDGGYSGVSALRRHLGSVDVIAALSDAMAVGAIARLRDLGVPPDDQPEVTGFDHVQMLGDVLPRFSTVEVPLEAFGEAALSLALDDADEAPDTRLALRATPIIHGQRLRRV